jgi:hypothetical protein
MVCNVQDAHSLFYFNNFAMGNILRTTYLQIGVDNGSTRYTLV